MTKERVETGKAPQIRVAVCDGDLVVRGWAEPLLKVRGNYEVEEGDEGFRVSGRGDLRLLVPVGANVAIGEVSGDLVIKEVAGASTAGQVHGNAILVEDGSFSAEVVHGNLVARGVESLAAGAAHGDVSARRVGSAKLGAIYGDFSGRRLDGAVTIEEASGDVNVREVSGEIAVGHAHRDVNLAAIAGRVMLGGVDGDIRLRGALPPGDHALSAHGDIVVRWPANAAVNIVAAARTIINRLPLQDVAEKEGQLLGRIGSGTTQLTLSADGQIVLKEITPVDEKWDDSMIGDDAEFEPFFNGLGLDMENMAARIEAEVNTHLSRVARDIETRFGPEFGQRMADKVARQADRVAERARRKGEWRGRGIDSAPVAASPRRSASPEEQLKILKMVESGAITPEDAGMLLEALEG